ncbi:MAG: UPF0147 family protein [Promethearchaeota archaeon]
MAPPRISKKRLEEAQKTLNNVEYILDQISGDNSVPRNIRRTTDSAKEALHTDDTPAVRASNAISLLDDLSQDPNCPVHTRTKIYQALSFLEQVKD